MIWENIKKQEHFGEKQILQTITTTTKNLAQEQQDQQFTHFL